MLIETLVAGRMGLPSVAGPTYKVPSQGEKMTLQIDFLFDAHIRSSYLLHTSSPHEGIPILHPTILILTKLKRWSTTRSSTRPKTIFKARTDKRDIIFMIAYLSDRNLKIEFEDYKGVEKEVLLRMVATLKRRMEREEEEDGVRRLKRVMYGGDWEVVEAMEGLEEEESMMPPPESPTPDLENAESPTAKEVAEEGHGLMPPSDPPQAQAEGSSLVDVGHVETRPAGADETTGP